LDLNQPKADPDEEIKRRLYKRGCTLANPEGCIGWANDAYRRDRSKYDDVVSVFKRNCETTVVFSCEDVGNLLRERGNDKEAIKAFSKVCTNDQTRGCEGLGQLSKNDDEKSKLRKDCDNGEGGACIAYNAALQETAKTLMIDRCLKASPRLRSTSVICEKASEMIDLPGDAKQFIGMQQACFRTAGNEFFGPWSRYIVEGLKEACINRDAEYAALTAKYKDSPDILFALHRHKSKNVHGKWVWETEQPETHH
jgi:hypothetical protein